MRKIAFQFSATFLLIVVCTFWTFHSLAQTRTNRAGSLPNPGSGNAPPGAPPASVYGPLPVPIVDFEELPNWKNDISMARKQKTEYLKKFYDEYAKQYANSRKISVELTPFEIYKLRTIRRFSVEEDKEVLAHANPSPHLKLLDTTSRAFENLGLVSVMSYIGNKFEALDKRFADIEQRLMTADRSSGKSNDDTAAQKFIE